MNTLERMGYRIGEDDREKILTERDGRLDYNLSAGVHRVFGGAVLAASVAMNQGKPVDPRVEGIILDVLKSKGINPVKMEASNE